ncbi:MAG: OmpA/MotB family protein [Nitrospiraceae bacterium]
MTRALSFSVLALVVASCRPPSVLAADTLPETVRMGSSAISFMAGFIRPGLPVLGSVAPVGGFQSTAASRRMYTIGDILYLKMARPGTASPGDLFTLYRRVTNVYHPRTGHHLGDLAAILGIASIVSITDDLATVRIERAYQAISVGDAAMRFVPPPQEEPAFESRALPENPGTVVALQPYRTLIAQGNVIYLDWGREDGLQAADVLQVFRVGPGIPMQTVADVQVIGLEDHTSTGMITRSTVPITVGDRFTFKEHGTRPETQLAGREPATPPAAPPPQVASVSKGVDVSKSLQLEASKGLIGIQQVGDRLIITLADQIEYESGQVQVNPEGLVVLKRVAEILKDVTDKRVEVEGHADDMPIGPTLKKQYPTNQELSEARATTVVRHLVEDGAIDPSVLSAIGFGDTRPVASNETEEGKKKNRRVEIVLYPKETEEGGPSGVPGPSSLEPPPPSPTSAMSTAPSLSQAPPATAPSAVPPTSSFQTFPPPSTSSSQSAPR